MHVQTFYVCMRVFTEPVLPVLLLIIIIIIILHLDV